MGVLYAFDFDHTIIHDNSDTAVWKLTPTPLPQEVKDVFDGRNWTQMMNKVFEFLHQQGVKVEDVEGFAKGLEPTPGQLGCGLSPFTLRLGVDLTLSHLLSRNGVLAGRYSSQDQR